MPMRADMKTRNAGDMYNVYADELTDACRRRWNFNSDADSDMARCDALRCVIQRPSA
jgi:hypothetical protein